MFCDIKDQMDNPVFLKILSLCLFDGSPEGICKALLKYPDEQFYGWVENDTILGVCGFDVHYGFVEICHIVTDENARGHGVGGAMVAALQDKYKMEIKAETDDDAAGFYRKCGFKTVELYKNYGDKKVRRWACVLPAPKSAQEEEQQHAALYPIILSEYNPAWPEWFVEEKANLERLIGAENIARISHYGSTLVPGLLAKPTIDILLEINEDTDVGKLMSAMPSSEYICLHGS